MLLGGHHLVLIRLHLDHIALLDRLTCEVEDEIEAVREVLGPGTTMSGFYSYGEFAPGSRGASCELHNQTMTLVTLAEV